MCIHMGVVGIPVRGVIVRRVRLGVSTVEADLSTTLGAGVEAAIPEKCMNVRIVGIK